MTKEAECQTDCSKMNFKDKFQFRCYPGVPCFTNCCADVTIFLTPYDVVRLKNRLELTSREFMDQHTHLITKEGQIIPLVILKMSENERKSCPFVTSDGCTVYSDRPWACRMFPLDVDQEEKFSVIAVPDKCKGLLEADTETVIEWLEDQGVMDYQRVNNYYGEITSHPKLREIDVTNDQIRQMIYMATYDLDRFRDFVLSSKFRNIFEFEDDLLERVRVDDTDLLKLGLDWIKFGLFGAKTLKVRPEVAELHQRRQDQARKQ
ncbi:MAG: YkgJ family cysteine cluster protein [Deltaproteobacteria bacterium]|nr:YkgJ family cysteine cluster protein [Deltaproteobacteria bacterium]